MWQKEFLYPYIQHFRTYETKLNTLNVKFAANQIANSFHITVYSYSTAKPCRTQQRCIQQNLAIS